MNMRALFASVLLVGAALLGGCAAVYVPATTNTPLLEKGQVEVTAGLRGLRGEAGAAWSPINRVLVTGGVTGNLGTAQTTTTNGPGRDTTYLDAHRQGSIGVGLYRPPTADKPSYLAVLGGVGWGYTRFFAFDDYRAASVFFPFPVPTRSGVYEARYRRYYGQFYFATPASETGPQAGESLRAVWLDYATLTYADVPIKPASRFFLEPSIFVRFGHGPLRYYLSGGLSMPLQNNSANPFSNRTARLRYLVSGGLVLRPDLLFRRKE